MGRALAFVLLCALIGCRCGETERAPEPIAPLAIRELPPPPELPALQRARLAYLFTAAELVARSWPLIDPDQVCLLLLETARQWVVNCESAPDGFQASDDTFRDRKVFWHDGDAFEVDGQRRSTAELLWVTPAAAQVSDPGATSTGLPAKHAWLMIGSLEALAQYHQAFPSASTEAWVSVAMHELVHVHQLREPTFARTRAQIASGAANPARLSELYERDSAYRERVAREYALLVEAARSAREPAAVRKALRDWQHLYFKRRASLAARSGGAALVEQDAAFSYLEGVARFVESDFLANTAQHPDPAGLAGDPRFRGYQAFVDRGYLGSPNRQLDTQYYYAIGYHLTLLLARIDPNWQSKLRPPGWLFGSVEGL